MKLVEFFEEAALKNRSEPNVKKTPYSFSARWTDGMYVIRLWDPNDRDAVIETHVPCQGTEGEIGYAFQFFLSQIFTAAIYGQKKKRFRK